jgi:molecular chaperone DnaJ
MSRVDYYEILEVERSATTDEIKRSYKRLAFEWHPDRNPGSRECEERFKVISEAYQVLSNPDKRARYDSFGHMSSEGLFTEFDFEAGFGDIFGDLFNEVFSGAAREKSRRGNDLRYSIDLTFDESLTGCEKTIKVPRQTACSGCGGRGAAPGGDVPCQSCNGRGELQYSQGFFAIRRTCPTCGGAGRRILKPCKECRGEGHLSIEHNLTVKIPGGISDGARLRMRGEGDAGQRGANGDLYIDVHVEEHPLFRRDGDDLHCTVPISFVQAALGDEIEIPVPGGNSAITIPAGTQSGQTFRMKGKGVPRLEGRGSGDLYIDIHVEVPVKLNRTQKLLLEEFARASEEENVPMAKRFVSKLQELINK